MQGLKNYFSPCKIISGAELVLHRLPEPARESSGPQELSISDDEQLRASLRALDGFIMEFVTNPAFRSSGTVDAQHSATAAESLTKVVELSRLVRHSAEKMLKARKAGGRKG